MRAPLADTHRLHVVLLLLGLMYKGYHDYSLAKNVGRDRVCAGVYLCPAEVMLKFESLSCEILVENKEALIQARRHEDYARTVTKTKMQPILVPLLYS